MAVRTRSRAKAIANEQQAIDTASSSSDDEVTLHRSASTSSISDNERGTPSKSVMRKKKQYTRSISVTSSDSTNTTEELPYNNDKFDIEAYLQKRVMTTTQEMFNAVTMIPGMVVAIYFILAGCWIQEIDQFEGTIETESWIADIAKQLFGMNEHSLVESFGCLHSTIFPALTALPPLTIVAAAVGNLFHSAVSIYYHWSCATVIEPRYRITHWTRRADNASIHFASIFASYATSNRLDYFLFNLVFNLDCMSKQLEKECHPRRNQSRLAASIILYLLPVVVNGHYSLFLQFALMFIMAGWFFGAYPVGGWSHGLFHIILSFLPYLVFQAAMLHPSSQLQINFAANCGSGMAVGQS